MKAERNATGTFDSAINTGATHQPWMGVMVSNTPLPERFAGDFWLTAARSQFDRAWLGACVWDGVLALVFVSCSAALGWAGAAWL